MVDDRPATYLSDVRPDPDTLDRDGLRWRTSSFSSGHGGNCVQVARVPGGGVAVRNSKDPYGPAATFSDNEWLAFLDGAEEFRFDSA